MYMYRYKQGRCIMALQSQETETKIYVQAVV